MASMLRATLKVRQIFLQSKGISAINTVGTHENCYLKKTIEENDLVTQRRYSSFLHQTIRFTPTKLLPHQPSITQMSSHQLQKRNLTATPETERKLEEQGGEGEDANKCKEDEYSYHNMKGIRGGIAQIIKRGHGFPYYDPNDRYSHMRAKKGGVAMVIKKGHPYPYYDPFIKDMMLGKHHITRHRLNQAFLTGLKLGLLSPHNETIGYIMDPNKKPKRPMCNEYNLGLSKRLMVAMIEMRRPYQIPPNFTTGRPLLHGERHIMVISKK